MARIRSLKPEFWLDRKLARSLTRDQRMLYLGLWNQADEWGRAQADPRLVLGQVFPYEDDLSPANVSSMLEALQTAGVLVLYEVDGDPYLFLPKLAKHQRLEPHKVPSRLPAPPAQEEDQQILDFGESESRANSSGRDSDGSAPGADSSALLYGAGSREQVAGGRVPDNTGPRRATRIPDGFTPSPADHAKAKQLGFTDADLDRITVEFIDYWRGIPGQRGVKLDWPATWRNRVRQVAERHPPRGLASASSNQPGPKPWEL